MSKLKEVRIWRLVKWLLLILVYLTLSGVSFGVLIIPIVGAIVLTIKAYNIEKERETGLSDNFTGNNLFFRYGYRINQTAFSIPSGTKSEEMPASKLADTLQENIKQESTIRLGAINAQVITITDKKINDSKNFVRLIFRTQRGSQLSHFVHYATTGKAVVAHYFTYVRGTYKWDDVVDFVLLSPFKIWGWGMEWRKDEYSILATISSYIANSYDLIDLTTFFESSYYVLMDETRNNLQELGLLSEELNQVIVNNIHNTQNVDVSNSRNVTFGGVTNTVRGTARKLTQA